MPLRTELSADVEAVEGEAWCQLAEALDAQYRARFGVEIVRHGRGAALVAPGLDSPWLNRALGFGFDAPFGEERLRELVQWYVSRGAARWMLAWSPDAVPATAHESFLAAGAQQVRPMVKGYAPLDRLVAVRPTNLRVEEIGRDDAARFEETVIPAMGVPAELGPVVRAAVEHAGWRYYLAFAGTEAIAGIALFVHGPAAWMGLAATREEYRGQGAQSALIARGFADAKAMGARWVSGETYSDSAAPAPSVRNGMRVGAELLYERPNFVFFTRSQTAAS